MKQLFNAIQMKNLFTKLKESLNSYLETKKWYIWGTKNEVEAHFYIVMGIGLLTLILWPIFAIFIPIFKALLISLTITTILAILAMVLRELTNKIYEDKAKFWETITLLNDIEEKIEKE